MATFLRSSDWHWGNDDAGGIPLRLQATDWLCELIKERKPDYYGNLGDSSVAHGWIETDVLCAMVVAERKVGVACIVTNTVDMLLIGNHDQTDREGKITLGPCFEGAHRHVVYRKPKRIEVKGLVVGAIPYCREQSVFREYVEQLGKVDVYDVHQDMNGAFWRPGQPATGWLSPTELTAPYGVFGGHYHHPQIIHPDPMTTIVGSMFYMSHHDVLIDIPRGAQWWDSDTRRMEWIECPFGPIYHTVPVERGTTDMARWEELVKLANDPRARRMRIRARFTIVEAAKAAEQTFKGAFEKLSVTIEREDALPGAAVPSSSVFAWGRENAGPIFESYLAGYAAPSGIDRALLHQRGAEHLGLNNRGTAA